jgi:hypothetical protein
MRAAEISATPVHDDAEIEAAAGALAREPRGGLIAAPDPFLNAHRGVAAIFAFRRYVTEGALMSYGPDTVDLSDDRLRSRPHPQGRETGRSTRHAADQI